MKLKKLFSFALALMATAVAWAQHETGDVITYEGFDYELLGSNIITNGSFDDGVSGWYAGNWAAANPSKYTLQESGGFDGGPFLQYSAGGAGADTNIRNKWAVEEGKTYMFICYTSGKTPDSNNLQYSFLKTSDAILYPFSPCINLDSTLMKSCLFTLFLSHT